jgi:hypothetical protein
MFIKYLDFISPPITFHHKGHLSHFSVVSGIISIISFVIIFIIAIQFSLEIIKRKNPAAYYFNTFTKDAGIFPLILHLYSILLVLLKILLILLIMELILEILE